MSDFLSKLLDSNERARVIRTLISHDTQPLAIGEISKRAGVTPRVALRELKALAGMNLLIRSKRMVVQTGSARGKKKISKAEECWILDKESRQVKALSLFVHEVSPTQFLEVERALKTTGRLSTVILSGVFMGDPSRPADLIIAGDAMNERRLERVVRDLEPKFGREIRYTLLSTPEFRYRLTVQDRLLRDVLDFPHRVLFNRAGLVS